MKSHKTGSVFISSEPLCKGHGCARSPDSKQYPPNPHPNGAKATETRSWSFPGVLCHVSIQASLLTYQVTSLEAQKVNTASTSKTIQPLRIRYEALQGSMAPSSLSFQTPQQHISTTNSKTPQQGRMNPSFAGLFSVFLSASML